MFFVFFHNVSFVCNVVRCVSFDRSAGTTDIAEGAGRCGVIMCFSFTMYHSCAMLCGVCLSIEAPEPRTSPSRQGVVELLCCFFFHKESFVCDVVWWMSFDSGPATTNIAETAVVFVGMSSSFAMYHPIAITNHPLRPRNHPLLITFFSPTTISESRTSI